MSLLKQNLLLTAPLKLLLSQMLLLRLERPIERALREIGGHDPDDVCPADGTHGPRAHYLDGAVRAEADVAALEEDHLARVLDGGIQSRVHLATLLPEEPDCHFNRCHCNR